MATLKEVARLAGVSASTVSRIINGKGEKCAGAAVQKRVWDAVRATGYVPNQEAKRLKEGGGAPKEAITVSCLFARAEDYKEDSFFNALAACVEEEVLRQGCRLGLRYSHKDALRLCREEAFAPGRTEGLVVLGKSGPDCEGLIGRFKKRVVHITLNQMEIRRDHIVCDGWHAAEMALQYLYEAGHRVIGYVGETEKEIRYRGYRAFMLDVGLTPGPIFPAAMNPAGGYRAVERILAAQTLPTALFCANDATAQGVLRGLAEAGVAVPAQMSVISIDNIPEAEQTKPLLTTVKVPFRDLGSFAVKTLLDRIDHGHTVPLNIFMPCELVVRQSVAAPRSDANMGG